MIETGSEYQLLQQFEAIPSTEGLSNSQNDKSTSTTSINLTDKESVVHKIIDGSKFDAFFDAIVNIIVVIPVK